MTYIVLIGLVALILGSLFMHLLSLYPGYVLISVGELAIEFSFWFGATMLVLTIVFTLFSIKFFRIIFDFLAGSFSWISERREKRAEKHTHSGLIHFMEGNWSAAKKHLLAAAKDVDQPLVHYLAAAKSAEHLGYTEERRYLLDQASKFSSQNQYAVPLTQAQMQFADGDYQDCLNTLKSMGEGAIQQPSVLALYRDTYLNLGLWSALISLLPTLKKYELMNAETFQQLEEKAYLSDFNERMKTESSAEALISLWQSVPENLRKNPRLVSMYGAFLHQYGQDQLAETLVRKTLNIHWQADLISLYGKLDADKKAQLKNAESWLRKHPDNFELNFILGKICLRNSLWGQAKEYFEKSLAIKEQVRVYQELADLAAKLGDHQKSLEMYKRGLAFAGRNAA